MITREFTHTFTVDLEVTRVGTDFVVSAVNVDSDGGPFHIPVDGTYETDRIPVEEAAADPIVGHTITVDGTDGPVDLATEKAVIWLTTGESDDLSFENLLHDTPKGKEE